MYKVSIHQGLSELNLFTFLTRKLVRLLNICHINMHIRELVPYC